MMMAHFQMTMQNSFTDKHIMTQKLPLIKEEVDSNFDETEVEEDDHDQVGTSIVITEVRIFF